MGDSERHKESETNRDGETDKETDIEKETERGTNVEIVIVIYRDTVRENEK